MYAKPTMNRWALTGPAASTFENGQTFEHEPHCPVQGNMVAACNCYVSRIRLIETPVGEFVATTEPDLAPELVFWQARAKHWERWAWIARGLFVITGIGAAIAGWL